MLYKIVCNIIKFFLNIFYDYKVIGDIPNKASIVAPNHNSFFDPPVLGASIIPRDLYFFARSSLFSGIFGKILRNLNAIPINRSSVNKSASLEIKNILADGKICVLFPEGKRSKDGNLGKMKNGVAWYAIENNVSIIPTYIDGTYEIWNRYRKFPKLKGKLVCIFGKPIDINEFDKDGKIDKDLVTEAICNKIKDIKEWYLSGALGRIP